MRFFVEIEPPETAYIHEAAQWIAFGKVPEFYSSPEWGGEFDIRGDESAELEFLKAAVDVDYHNLPEAIPEVLSGIDLQTFQEALGTTLGTEIEEIKRQRQNYENMLGIIDERGSTPEFSEVRIQMLRENLARCDREMDLAKAIQPTIETFLSYEERAKAKLFYALSAGELDAIGWHSFTQKDDNSETVRWEERSVTTSHWRMSEIDWQRANLGKREDSSPSWVAVRVNFQELLALFPQPDLPGENLTVSRYGRTLTHIGAPKSRGTGENRGKGRPLKGGGAVKTAVLNHFSKRHAASDLPEKKEAIIEEARAWAQDLFGEDLSRTTLQRYLKPLFSKMTK